MKKWIDKCQEMFNSLTVDQQVYAILTTHLRLGRRLFRGFRKFQIEVIK